MNKVTSVLLKSFFVNAILVIIKFVIGFIGKSSALIADGIHSLSDFSTDLIAIVGSKLSMKPADDNHPYGHGRMEYLTSIIIGIVILILGLTLIFNSEEAKIPDVIVIYASIFTIIVKFIIARYLCLKGKSLDNQILISSGKESSMDVISSFVVLISSILVQFSNKVYIFKYLDKISTIIIGIFILKTSIDILKSNINLILGEVVLDEEYLNSVSEVINSVKGVKNIDDLKVIKQGSYNEARVYISVDKKLSLVKSHNIAHKIEDVLKNDQDLKIRYVIVHINPYIKKNQ